MTTSTDKPIEFMYEDAAGTVTTVSVEPGTTLMQAARDHGVIGIDGDCGGCAACGTCLIEMPPEIAATLPAMSNDEKDLVSFTLDDAGNCRLGCQLQADPSMQGMKVKVATDR